MTTAHPQDRHEPRGRKPNDQLPPSRAREVQRAFRLRRAEHLAALEERINLLESENSQLRALLSLPEADRQRIGSGPTGRGKSLREGGVPMSERVRARKEARERERRAKGLAAGAETSEDDSARGRDSMTLSPRATSAQPKLPNSNSSELNGLPLFGQPDTSFNYQLPLPFNMPVSPDHGFPDFTATSQTLDTSNLFKPGNTPSYASMFSMFDSPEHNNTHHQNNQNNHNNNNNNNHTNNNNDSALSHRRSPISPPISNPNPTPNPTGPQPDLLTRLKQCCHLSDSHVVNDPGLLIFATRLCQSYPCSFSGAHPDPIAVSDSEHLMLEDSWRALKQQLDPTGDADGENRINTGRMAAELVCRAANSRGPGFIVCRYREGMSIKRSMIKQLIQGLGGNFE